MMIKTINRADVERMIKDWQAECANHPALHNQGNVLLDRLEAVVPALEAVSAKITNELKSLHMSEEGEFGRGYAEALAFALDAIDVEP